MRSGWLSRYEIPRKCQIALRQCQTHVYKTSTVITTVMYLHIVNSTDLTVGGSKDTKIHKTTYSCFKMNKNVARFMMLVGVETVCEKGYIRWTKVNNHNYIQRKLDELLQNQILECLFNAILQSLWIIIIWGLFSENKQLNHHHMIN